MTEINNNIPNYGFKKIDRVDIKKDNIQNINEELPKEHEEPKYIQDTGVLGRSQIHGLNGGNIVKSVDEAVSMAENHPDVLGCSETIFDTMYKKYINSGMSESDAYLKAVMAEKELLDVIRYHHEK